MLIAYNIWTVMTHVEPHMFFEVQSLSLVITPCYFMVSQSNTLDFGLEVLLEERVNVGLATDCDLYQAYLDTLPL